MGEKGLHGGGGGGGGGSSERERNYDVSKYTWCLAST